MSDEFKPEDRVIYERTGELGSVVRESDNPDLVFVLYDEDFTPKATRKADLKLRNLTPIKPGLVKSWSI